MCALFVCECVLLIVLVCVCWGSRVCVEQLRPCVNDIWCVCERGVCVHMRGSVCVSGECVCSHAWECVCERECVYVCARQSLHFVLCVLSCVCVEWC